MLLGYIAALVRSQRVVDRILRHRISSRARLVKNTRPARSSSSRREDLAHGCRDDRFLPDQLVPIPRYRQCEMPASFGTRSLQRHGYISAASVCRVFHCKAVPPAEVSRRPRPKIRLRRKTTRRYVAPLTSLSSARNASIISSNRTTRPAGATRKSGAASTAQASEAHEARIARFSLTVRSGSSRTAAGDFERLRRMKQIVKLPIPEHFVATLRFALHGHPPLFGEAARRDRGPGHL